MSFPGFKLVLSCNATIFPTLPYHNVLANYLIYLPSNIMEWKGRREREKRQKN